ncbi:MAG: hypothetical protein DRO67_00160 [Candidatus Asgardarchaeum californiense]|nr:MAG: hypothetical protein DRO67_00160 [Candidatus Asgardarchaeum californiense]
MGAMEFESIAKGSTAKEAFQNAREEAFYDYGHSGYTGTIAEKNTFRMIHCECTSEAVSAKMDEVMENESHWIQDKWGPAGCIKLENNEWLFFGFASS